MLSGEKIEQKQPQKTRHSHRTGIAKGKGTALAKSCCGKAKKNSVAAIQPIMARTPS
jgi:hypothetical protein